MSTAGKVLTVLVLLVMVGWVIMLSAVTQLNVNHEAKIKQQRTELQRLTDDVTKAARNVIQLTESTRDEQDTRDRDLRGVFGRIAIAEQRQSYLNEVVSRIKIQVADSEAAATRSTTNLANRNAEKAKAEADLAQKRDDIAKSQALNADLRDQLAKLQTDFKRVLADNTAKLARAADPNAPASKPASNRRTPPAS